MRRCGELSAQPLAPLVGNPRCKKHTLAQKCAAGTSAARDLPCDGKVEAVLPGWKNRRKCAWHGLHFMAELTA